MSENNAGPEIYTTGIKEATTHLLPIGERTIGTADPKTLSEESFNQSSELLYHAAAKPFAFSQDVDYTTFIGPYSATVGSGLYTTDDLAAVQKYIEVRKISQGAEPVLMRFHPYEARIYDMRAQGNESINAPVPRSIFEDYRQFVINYYKSKFPNGAPAYGTPNWNLHDSLREHKSYLNQLFFGEPKDIDLREMLSSNGQPGDSEKGALTFTQYMLDKGYDGLVYNEGGDGWTESAPSYVFYNPKKVGTFETWQNSALQADKANK